MPTTALDLYSLRQVTRKILWTWVTRTTLTRDENSPQAPGKICMHARGRRMMKSELRMSRWMFVLETCLGALKERGVLDFELAQPFQSASTMEFSRTQLVFVAQTASMTCLSNPGEYSRSSPAKPFADVHPLLRSACPSFAGRSCMPYQVH